MSETEQIEKSDVMKPSVEGGQFQKLPFRMHPRVFESLGKDLVTNDVVAVIELVKNSYDAYARNVWVRFRENESYGRYLEIEDDGQGMTKEILEDVWCLVATPFKAKNPLMRRGESRRRVVGEKGLGRLSALRLGNRLRMLTQTEGSPCWEVQINWAELLKADNLSESFMNYRPYNHESPFTESGSGTLLTIYDLNNAWDQSCIFDLQNNLARLISPFAQAEEFNIFFSDFQETLFSDLKVQSHEFLKNPKYKIIGNVDKEGIINAQYEFAPIMAIGVVRKKPLSVKWKTILRAPENKNKLTSLFSESPNCGPFDFEIRAWDIASDDTGEIAKRFKLKKDEIRKAISAHKGISIYRDGVLVLPKSDNTRDWMGLDLRRVSRTGKRLSTNQIVGYVSISAESNPQIRDTSDRERLVSCTEVTEFEVILTTIIAKLENERDSDRREPEKEKSKTKSLFDELSASNLLGQVTEISKQGGQASEIVPMVKEHKKQLEITKDTLQKRFIYYSRLATIGSIAAMLVHEIRNRTTVIGSFLEFVKQHSKSLKGTWKVKHDRAIKAVESLEHLSDTFLPLASRSFNREKRHHSILEERIKKCLEIRKEIMSNLNIKCHVPESQTQIAVDPGELDAIILNLLANSEYWLDSSPKDHREIEFCLKPISGGRRVRVSVHDTGPGIDKDDVEKIFWPGVTSKPDGIGMGLTVASELIAAYGGNMSTMHPGQRGGASFMFDLPVQK